MNGIPQEIIELIARYLDASNLLKVLVLDKKWFSVIYPFIWKDVVIYDWDQFKKRNQKPFCDYKSSIKSLHVRINTKLPMFKKLLQGMSCITELLFDFPAINDEDVWVLMKYCKLLRRLSISSNRQYPITDESLQAFGKHDSLRHLMLKYQDNLISERGIMGLANGFRGNLSSFRLELKEIQQRTIPTFTTAFEPLTSNQYYIPSFSQESQKRFVDALCCLVSKHSKMIRFGLDWPCDDKPVLETASKHLKNLEILSLGNSSSTTELLQLLIANPNLHTLYLYEINLGTEITVQQLLQSNNNKKLLHIELHGVCHFEHILETIPQFTNLKTLVFYPTTRSASFHTYSAASLKSIAFSCNKLTKLAIPIHDNQQLIQLATWCPYIIDLDIQDGRAIDGHGLVIMCTKLKLTSISFGFSWVNDQTITTMTRHWYHSLRNIVFATPNRITTTGFVTLCKGFPNLESMYNLSCSISVQGIIQGLLVLKKCRVIGLSIVRSTFTPMDIEKIQQTCTQVKLVV